jgi:hypothetical protein
MRKKSVPSGNIQIKASTAIIQEVYQAGSHLVIFRSLLGDPIAAHFLQLLKKKKKDRKRGPRRIRRRIPLDSFRARALSQDMLEPTVGTVWQNHLLNLILDNENPFSESASNNLKLEEQAR